MAKLDANPRGLRMSLDIAQRLLDDAVDGESQVSRDSSAGTSPITMTEG